MHQSTTITTFILLILLSWLSLLPVSALNNLSNILLSPLPTSSSPSNPTYANSTTPFPYSSNASQTITLTAPIGRYGHSAVYLSSTDTILFIGGQVGSNGTYITSQVLSFNLASTFLFGPNRPLSVIPDNPSIDLSLSIGLPPHAWAASAIDCENRTWLIGGVTQNCEIDAPAYVLPLPSRNTTAGEVDAVGWIVPALFTTPPARRRQIQAVSVFNLTSFGADIWVFGGIAEQYTCSEDTIGYLGIDRWSSVEGVVETIAWESPDKESFKSFTPPVSDYSATLLRGDETSIVVVGGQTATGDLVTLETVLLFNTELRNWERKNVTGSLPSSRMGHIAISLPSGSVLIHGGLSGSLSPMSSVYLLNPPSDLSAFSTSPWTWSTFGLSNHSMESPSRAWHSGTLIEGGTIVVAFGIDAHNGDPSDDIWFLQVDEETMKCTWSDTFYGNVDVILAQNAVVNPKAYTQTTTTAVEWTPSYTDPSPPTISTTATTTSKPNLLSSTSASLVPTSSSLTPMSIPVSQNISTISAQKKSIATGVGSALGAVALFAGVFLLCRRYQSSKKDHRGVKLTEGRPGMPPVVSTLLFTRPSHNRAMSLGSTLSELPEHSHFYSDEDDGSGQFERESQLGTFREGDDVGAGGMMRDPFSDAWRVSELGELARAPSRNSSYARTIGVGGGRSPKRDKSDQGSVRSVPFLNAVHRTSTSTSSSNRDELEEERDVVTEELEGDDGKYTRFPNRIGLREFRRRESLSDVGGPANDWDSVSNATTDDGRASRTPSTRAPSKPPLRVTNVTNADYF